MTEEEAVKKLIAVDPYDEEARHAMADNILIEFLAENGYERLAKQYEDMQDNFWYA